MSIANLGWPTHCIVRLCVSQWAMIVIIENHIRLAVDSYVYLCPAQAMQNFTYIASFQPLCHFWVCIAQSGRILQIMSLTHPHIPPPSPHFSQQKRPVCSNAPSPRTQNAAAWASSPSLSPLGATAYCCSSHPKQVRAARTHSDTKLCGQHQNWPKVLYVLRTVIICQPYTVCPFISSINTFDMCRTCLDWWI